MKIKKIDLYRIAVPYSAGRSEIKDVVAKDFSFNAASSFTSKMESVMVKITLDNGVFGWGEAFGHAFNPVVETCLQDIIIPFFTQTEIEDYDHTLDLAHKAFHAFGLSGAIMFGLSAIDIAVWDIRAKLAQQPLYQLLGGKQGDIELYASLVNYDNDPQQILHHINRAYQQGFRKIKLHETNIQSLAEVKKNIPADLDLMVDVNCPWSFDDIKNNQQQLSELNLGWLEEPIWPPEDYVTLSNVRKLGIKISAGENATGEQGFFNMFHHQAVDIAQPSVTKIGGITGMRNVINLAKQHHVKVIPHCFYYGPGMLATAHIVAALGDVALEVPYIQFEQPLHGLLNYTSQVRLPDASGLGFDINTDMIKQYQV